MHFSIERISNGPKNHMFGFHDLFQTNNAGDLALALEINNISRPPLPGESCKSGFINLASKEFVHVHDTHTWNYPQGARQQWIGNTDCFTCNDRAADGSLFSWICDARTGRTIDRLFFPVHCIAEQSNIAVYVDYDRLFAVGAYGYVPKSISNYSKIEDIPSNTGLWIGNIEKNGKGELLISMMDIAKCGEIHPKYTGFPHYVTHPMINPSGRRIAFLHRYRLPDGGETTRLMTVGIDGRDLRCLAKGFLSHFTWIDEDELFIWGANQPKLFAMREAWWMRIPCMPYMAKLTKEILKHIYQKKKRNVEKNDIQHLPSMAFLKIKDSNKVIIEKCAIGEISEDGHPMARPGQLKTVISDTYPNENGDRQLYLYDLVSEVRTDIGVFRRIFKSPDIDTFDWRAVQSGIDRRIAKKFDLVHYLFARSGLHCDLHPRWSHDGRYAFFDSIHEGTRQLYRVKINAQE